MKNKKFIHYKDREPVNINNCISFYASPRCSTKLPFIRFLYSNDTDNCWNFKSNEECNKIFELLKGKFSCDLAELIPSEADTMD